MGNEGSTHSKKKAKTIDKNKLDILLKQIYFTAQLNKDRRKGQQTTKEKELLALIREPTNKRSKDNEYSKASAATNDTKSIKAHEHIMRYADILKDNQMVIQLSNGDSSKIRDLLPYVESIIWGCQKCNIDCVKQLEEFLVSNFGLEDYNQVIQFTQVTSELKSQFNSVLPSEKEVKLYLIDFCNRNGISLETMNEIGHGLSPTELADLPDPGAQTGSKGNEPTQGNQGGSQGNSGFNPNNNYTQPGFPQGNFPSNNFQGGYPPYGGFPQSGGYPQSGFPNYPPNNYQPNYQQPGGYPPYGGYSQQGGFPQQGGYPQSGIPQGGQGGYPQSGFSQGGQGGYQPYSSSPQSNPGGSQQPTTSNQGSQNPYQPPSGNNQGGNVPLNSAPKNDPSEDIGGYPTFQKFTEPPNSSGKAGYDPLDELDMRLKNIKNGL